MAGVYRSGVMLANKKKTTKPAAFDRKIPVNPKYKHVKPTVDTGASLSKYLAKIEEIRKNYRYKKDELFKRMKWTTFVQLVLQIAEFNKSKEQKIDLVEEVDIDISTRPYTADTADLEVQKIQDSSPSASQASTDEEFTDPASATDQVNSADSGLYTSRSTLQDVIQGVGEIDQLTTPCLEKELVVAKEDENSCCPYLLLDVRDKDEFDQCHIITAHNYPSAMLSRTTNSETKEMLSYKNKPGRLILLYDYDENICPRVASTIAERGFDNLFLLSGGLKVAEKLFPQGLIVGHITPEPHNRQRIGSPLVANQTEFCSKDLEELAIFLGKALQDKSVGNRLSKSVLSSRCASNSSFHSSHYAQQPPPTPSSVSLSSASSRRPFRT
ncbi:centrosomal protein of 41 kDa B [Octopus sinensis]|uniref:Centrosomal protein of 41 kDa B n=1 Tax=Octopus sinensis TaxID=2607531 RepID=A0A6P7TQA4_9MOLL|nr:centrosomal protein of 41 kDa B [Octopus sinensis]